MSVNTVQKMIAWIEDNIQDNPTLTEMSRFVGYSEYYCSSKFREYTGVTFKEYVLKRKLALASCELLETNFRVIDIAMNYGFSSNESFTRAFVREYGCSPSRFRALKPNVKYYERKQTIIDPN